MKNFKLSIAYLAMFAMIFTSCSKEEVGGANQDSDMATLSFGAIVNDIVTNRASKQAIGDLPDCTDDEPAYVEIVLMMGDDEVVGTSEDPYRVDLVAGEVFTVEDEALELTPGDYTLSHFSVYNADGDLIWIAPRTGSPLGEFVDITLPLDIDLRAGVKKYVDVNVLCFDNRNVNQYGYLFFELIPTELIEFCFFANYCPTDEGGRDYPARYSVSIWQGTNANGTPLYTNVINNTDQYDNGDFYATPLCFALPNNDNPNQPYLYYEVTLLDWDANYGDAEDLVIRGTLTAQDIYDNFDGDDNVNYEHLRFGCEVVNCPGVPTPGDMDGDCIPDGEDPCPQVPSSQDMDGDCIPDGEDPCPAVHTDQDMDGDCIPDGQDNCPEVANPDQEDSDNDGIGDACDEDGGDDCETAIMWGDTELNDLDGVPANRWGWVEHFQGDELEDGEYQFNYYAAAGQNEVSNGYLAGVVTIIVAGNDVHVQIDLEDGVSLDEAHVYFSSTNAPTTTAFGQWTSNLGENPSTEGNLVSYTRDGDFWIGFHGVVCR
ncbi:thrombospondin type 3 repeat-containing protein [Antarcticibacterium sp. 1MA-6-2]|uniref:thrombospondin type 3 repeat-containing protein n=1 Tax=Antarcticibacterium sp. 1MA-6-2 TaxID=2908210 RepID=UPI001F2B0026|nr:thrombospondin type 3 repeat-containing protein [Antarcticibacterium sp. 1MA-6-2]UJH91266.1 thrombospondin type 3 repeat-containing protein [Antarcticibacterium sp. 1MA-6-2]